MFSWKAFLSSSLFKSSAWKLRKHGPRRSWGWKHSTQLGGYMGVVQMRGDVAWAEVNSSKDGKKSCVPLKKHVLDCRVGSRVWSLDIECSNPRTWEAVSGGFQVRDHSGFHSKNPISKSKQNILLPCLWMKIYQGAEKMPVCCRVWVASCCHPLCHSATSWKLSCGPWYLRAGCGKVELELTTATTNCTQRRWVVPLP